MHVVIWSYVVMPGKEASFERTYGADGEWADFFGKSEAFVGIDLLKSGSTYVTLDRWRDRESFERFRTENSDEWATLDKRGGDLVDREQFIGAFDEIEGE